MNTTFALFEYKEGIRLFLQAIGEDPKREGLKDTPDRVIKAWGEMLDGYKQSPSQHMKTFKDGTCDEMVVIKDIDFTSVCEHHMLPFMGVAHIGYIPGSKIIGLSKPARFVDCFAHRLQVQERLVTQIADALWKGIKPKGCGVVITATHLCMSCRGVRKQRATMTCSSLMGSFKTDPSTRAEFLSFIRS